jgi:nucleotide-binding universal stress UspA family protein
VWGVHASRNTDGPSVIVVGVDGSPSSMRAGAYAAGVARRAHATLVVVYVETQPAMARFAPEAGPAMADSLSAIAEELRQETEHGAERAGITVQFVALRGDPYLELVRVAQEQRADNVIVGASTSAGHRFAGSIAVRLVRAGKWPVTVVP